MGRFILVRLLQTFFALIGVSLLIFVLVRASGDPALMLISSTATEDEIGHLTKQLGLDRPLPAQYMDYVKKLARGDLGKSLFNNRLISEMIAERLPNSLKLGVISFFISMTMAFALGILGATRRDTWMDNGIKFIAILGQALPGFWVSIMVIYLFSVVLRVTPASGMGTPAHYILPVGTMAFFLLPGIMRLVRSSMLDVLDSEYIKLARIKGLPERVVIWKHALRNALIAPLTAAGIIFRIAITGAVVTETVFSWPGVGRLLVESINSRDFPITQAVVLMLAFLVLMINLLVDILYAYIDPQIRYQKS